jgi:16S rRNA (guanine(1405)-N(7))-methyltransferase
MPLAPAARYTAIDMDGSILSVVGDFFARMPIRGEARCQDVLVRTPAERADLVFLLKLLPSLDRQRPGGGFDLLRSPDFGWAVVSYPTGTLGGRRVGMRSYYGRRMDEFLQSTGWPFTRMDFAEELFYLVRGG